MEQAKPYVSETIGTFLIVLVGVGSVHVAVLTGALSGLGQVAAVWGAGVCLAILVTAARSGAHLNPAITVALSAYRRFPPPRAAGYIFCQLLGAVLAAFVLHGIFGAAVRDFEQREGIVRGAAGSERSAMMYGEYFPNPGGRLDSSLVDRRTAFAAEAAATAVLALVVFALTDPGRRDRPALAATAAAIGATVAAMICLVAPLTQAGLNPARDLGPRIVSWFLGWGEVAIPGPRGGWLSVYVAGPVAGALVGAGLHELLLRQKDKDEPKEDG
jgi:glycerol uptake facilitator protein